MPSVQLDLSGALGEVPFDFNPRHWVFVTPAVRTLSAFEAFLRQGDWGGLLRAGKLWFERDGGVVDHTGCLFSDMIIEVFAPVVRRDSAGAAGAAAAPAQGPTGLGVMGGGSGLASAPSGTQVMSVRSDCMGGSAQPQEGGSGRAS